MPYGDQGREMSAHNQGDVRRPDSPFCSIHLLDAPVSGGPKGAKSGRLAIWVGGEEAISNAKQVLDAFSDAARYIGPIGAGSVAKLVHNLCRLWHPNGPGGGLSMGVKAGVEPLAP